MRFLTLCILFVSASFCVDQEELNRTIQERIEQRKIADEIKKWASKGIIIPKPQPSVDEVNRIGNEMLANRPTPNTADPITELQMKQAVIREQREAIERAIAASAAAVAAAERDARFRRENSEFRERHGFSRILSLIGTATEVSEIPDEFTGEFRSVMPDKNGNPSVPLRADYVLSSTHIQSSTDLSPVLIRHFGKVFIANGDDGNLLILCHKNSARIFLAPRNGKSVMWISVEVKDFTPIIPFTHTLGSPGYLAEFDKVNRP